MMNGGTAGLLPDPVAALGNDDGVAGAGEEIGGGDHPVGVEPFTADGGVGEGVGGEKFVQRGVFKGDTADDDVQLDVEIGHVWGHLQVGLHQLGAVGEGFNHADVSGGLRADREFVDLLLREDRSGRTAQAGLQDRGACLERLEIEAHAAGGGRLDADLEQRGVVGGEEHGRRGSVDENFLFTAIADRK